MQKLIIAGGKKLIGTINISGSKNATLPILAASILNKNKVIIQNIPLVKDVETMIDLLSLLGSKVKLTKKKKKIEILNNKKLSTFAPYKLVKTMRAGVLVLGPLLARYNKAKVSLPGGCAIGSRPVDLHLGALKKMGVNFKIKDGYINAISKNGLVGNKITFPKISVGATENAMMAACLAKGKTILNNCACEPEIKDLGKFLIKMGCKIKWLNKRKIEINGVKNLKTLTYRVMFDRIEAGTYMIASAVTDGRIKIKNINPEIIKNEILVLKKMGVIMTIKSKEITVRNSRCIKKINLKTSPYPGFPTDLQAQIMVLMCGANGISKITENIFENRFMHIPELNRMGAKIKIKGNQAIIQGKKKLNAAELMATDLRASVSLVLAALSSKSKTTINRVYHLDRGYENIEKKLSNCGAQIKRIK
ncbi:MAG: UDP-N-acetylglucosamine 1-carboxyvinyltransferase [Candidatus Pelagibacter sp.]|jgi:UDP-N-acetylglucosamine 1-carboxyvinyltransferase|nr:UDP-N-acetylglucosamine 1-carboxyvinyltransferase [Candidatus Pelagibacter sp.]MDP6440973.1 UDP-N-acetylglucosamine 1-carboxyvinyltransferase [Pelagibacteraceae bacterium]MDP6785120.1 UDP-N-acetylglucosamine 1-carboxyvinyltransferase [Alphaproteobacteria bacterium]|tara:strand:- start:493 stop:1752 length:1260 start_codon:yes stop_codon:yes gene_type:complete